MPSAVCPQRERRRASNDFLDGVNESVDEAWVDFRRGVGGVASRIARSALEGDMSPLFALDESHLSARGRGSANLGSYWCVDATATRGHSSAANEYADAYTGTTRQSTSSGTETSSPSKGLSVGSHSTSSPRREETIYQPNLREDRPTVALRPIEPVRLSQDRMFQPADPDTRVSPDRMMMFMR